MTYRLLLLAGAMGLSGVGLSGAAVAAPPAPVTSDQLVCDLTGDCGSDAAEPTKDKPDTRGFSIVRAGAPATPAAPAAPAARGPERRPVAHIATTSADTSAPGRRAPRGEVGHTNLEIAFQEGSATLTEQGRATADTFARALQSPAMSGKRFMIAGHTSAVGSRAFNQDLSERRAQAVVDYLVGKGAPRSQFDAKGFGFDKPLPGTAPRSPANRRVEVVAQP